jgi:hypothetical protein
MAVICSPLRANPVSTLLALCASGFLGAEWAAFAKFPNDWKGTWEGPCTLTPPLQDTPPLKMRLRIENSHPPDSLTWEITYLGLKSGLEVRPYRLLPGSRPNHWLIDEGNGIRLDHYSNGDFLYGEFEVPGARIFSREELRQGRLEVELLSFAPQPTTAGPVPSFELKRLQKCQLQLKSPPSSSPPPL